MIHALTPKIVFQTTCLSGALLALCACAGGSAQYPSFAVPTAKSEQGRVSLRFPDVAVPEIPASKIDQYQEAMPLELDVRLATIQARADKASAAFANKLGPTREWLATSANSEVGSPGWTEAQLRLADLTTHHSEARMALAELDVIAAQARLALAPAEEWADVAKVQADLARSLDEQAAVLDEVNAEVARE